MHRCFLAILFALSLRAATPDADPRESKPADQDTPRTLTPPTNATDWADRAWQTRLRILASAGLYPLPARTPLNPKVFGRLDREGYSVEKASFESLPGLYVTGNLYRPKGGGAAKYPAILSPHGHWAEGRLTENDDCSVPARCVQLARLGFLVFAYDMIGYNDSCQFSPLKPDGSLERPKFYDNHTAILRDPTNELWGLSILGLQLWNSIRGVDFLETLADVDTSRIGATGASGGGTQTFLLTAVDDRIKVEVPAVMVSHSMQGGCRCENAPGLRVEFSNLDFAAVAAPRPLMLIGDTGDWTKTQTEIEAPALASVYRMLGAEDHFRAVRFPGKHNYNLQSREAMYPWFSRWLGGGSDAQRIEERPHPVEKASDMRLFPDNRPPAGAASETQLAQAWVRARSGFLASVAPHDRASLDAFRDHFARNAWTALMHSWTPELWRAGSVTGGDDLVRTSTGEHTPFLLLARDTAETTEPPEWAVIMADPGGLGAFRPGGMHAQLAASLVATRYTVLAIEPFQTGSRRVEEVAKRSPFERFNDVYNLTVAQQRARDFQTAAAYAKLTLGAHKVLLIGWGASGLPALLSAPNAEAVIADTGNIDSASDAAWLDPERFVPNLRGLGGPGIGLAVAAPNPAWVFNTGGLFDLTLAKAAAAAAGSPGAIHESPAAPSEQAVYTWIRQTTTAVSPAP